MARRTTMTFTVIVETEETPEEHKRRVNWARSQFMRAGEYMDRATVLTFAMEDGMVQAMTVGGLKEPSEEMQISLADLQEKLS